jgi:hypothetical protein
MHEQSPTRARLSFLEVAGFDVSPDRTNIPDLKAAGWSLEQIAETYGVSVRTVQRYLHDSHPCPGYPEGSCMTKVQGGGLCGFCRRSRPVRVMR